MRVSAFAATLRSLRSRRGFTQTELAERARLSVRTISDLERGVKLMPRLTTIRLLAQALNADAEESASLLEAASPRPSAEGTHAQQTTTRSGALLQIKYARRTDGASTAYGVAGNGPVLVIPPGLISHLEWWETAPGVVPWLGALAKHRTVVLYDRHGCGLSDRDRTNFTPEDDMQDIEAVADAVAPHDLDLLGDSFGSQPAIAYAIRHPERVRQLVLHAPLVRISNGGCHTSSEVRPPASEGFLAERRLALAALRRVDLDLYVRTIAMQMFPSGTDEETFRAFVRIHRMAATVQMQEGLDTVRFDLEPLLDKVITPTMVLHRRGDQACPFGIGENVARRIAGARFVPLEGDSHFPWVGDWQSMAGAILDFLLDGSDRGSARAPIKR